MLAWILAQSDSVLDSELDFALALAGHAYRLAPTANIADTLAVIQLRRGELAAALQTLETALLRDPSSETLRHRLGIAHLAVGNDTAAAAASRTR